MDGINKFFCTVLQETSSTQDMAFQLAEKDALPVWGSVLALEQFSGRGQLRRPWQSMEGNLMVSLRLPAISLFSGQAAAIIAGALIGVALRRMKFHVFLKWPNDILIIKNGLPRKTGGILLEERQSIIIAGIGINLAQAPELSFSAGDQKIQAGSLRELKTEINTPMLFWYALFNLMQEIFYKYSFQRDWLNTANFLLYGKNEQVRLSSSAHQLTGILKGINAQGEVRIEGDDKIHSFFSGDLEFLRNKTTNP